MQMAFMPRPRSSCWAVRAASYARPAAALSVCDALRVGDADLLLPSRQPIFLGYEELISLFLIIFTTKSSSSSSSSSSHQHPHERKSLRTKPKRASYSTTILIIMIDPAQAFAMASSSVTPIPSVVPDPLPAVTYEVATKTGANTLW